MNILDCRTIPLDFEKDQKLALIKIEKFFKEDSSNYFLLSGRAGSGKTSIIENIARFSSAVVLAPTNAAVQRLRSKISDYDKITTIHKTVYGEPDKFTGEWIPKTIEFDTTYIIDESSMIDQKILRDLLDLSLMYRNKFVFVGDDFQLPPVGLDPELFKWENGLHGECFDKNYKFHLDTVKRHAGEILKFSNIIRDERRIPVIDKTNIKFLNKFGKRLKNSIEKEDYVVIVSTNNNRMFYNNEIRKIKYGVDEPKIVEKNEKVISVANNTRVNSEIWEIENPEIIEVFKDVNVNIGNIRFPKIKTYDMYYIGNGMERLLLIPDLDIPSLHGHQLVECFKKDERFVMNVSGKKRWNRLINIATYGYCVTCHKAQGNEYDNVFVDCSWLPDSLDIYRWFYTAFTRAKNNLYIKHSKYFDY